MDMSVPSHIRAIDAESLEAIIRHASARDAQRLRRTDVEHANAWISALPSTVDGGETIMLPRVYLTAVRRLLGIPVIPNSIPCLFASKPWMFTVITPYAARSQEI